MDFIGTQGNDTLVGTADDDALNGLEGNDTLRAGAGYDNLDGGLGDDLLDGGADSDWVFYTQAPGPVTVNLGTGRASGAFGNDSLIGIENVDGSGFDDVLTGDAGNNTLNGRAGNDTLVGGAGVDTVAYWDATGAVNANLATGLASGGDGNDSLSGIEDLTGSIYDDVLVGDANANRLDGAGGRDTLSGGAGADTFVLGGNDPTEVDRITDLTNGDILQFGAGELSILILSGDNFSGLLQGEVMLGTPTNGITRLYVGLDATPGADVAVDLVGNFVVNEFTTDRDDDTVPYGAVVFDATLNIPRNLVGTAADDSLRGGNSDDTLDGGAGSDYLSGSNGNDILRGGDSYDNLSGGLGDDTIDGGADADWVYYSSAPGPVQVNLATGRAIGAFGDDVLSGIESVYGSSFDDVLTGDAQDNTLNGRAGDDTLVGGPGRDQVVYWDAPGPVNANLATGRVSGADGNDILVSIENLYGSYADDVLAGDDGDNHIGGNNGNDQIDGAAGNDLLDGNDGDDTLTGGDGDDELQGGQGNDSLVGGNGSDSAIFNGRQSDYIITSLGPMAWRVEDKTGLEGIDTLSGIEKLRFVIVGTLDGTDLSGGSGFDIVSFEAATSAVTVNLQEGRASGDRGVNTLVSIEGAIGSARFGDILIGNAQDNELDGLGGVDQLEGGAGNDRLDGGPGADRMSGGSGADLYFVDDEQDQVIELDNPLALGAPGRRSLDLSSAIDRVVASINYTLGNFVENLDLASAAGDLAGGGNALDNLLNGNEGNNRFTGAGGNDSIDGKAGIDTAVYAAARIGYLLSKTETGFTVAASTGNEGLDTLANVERLQFSDAKVAIDLTSGGNAAKTAQFLGLLGFSFLSQKDVVGTVLGVFDQTGINLSDAFALVLNTGLVNELAGDASDTAFVKLIHRNLVGTEASDAVAATLATELLKDSGGAYSRIDLLNVGAGLDANLQHVGLVGTTGLLATGLEYV